MIVITDDTVFNTDAEWIVNTVNCVGIMGKGLALEFALRFPKLNTIYKEQCKRKEIITGRIYNYEIDGINIINFPTKYDYRYPSNYKWIEEGLVDFVKKYKELGISSIAFPLLGCNNGELDKGIILSMMKKYLELDDVRVYICKSIVVGGKEKEMLENFKRTSIEEIADIAKLNKNQIEEIRKKQMKIERFYQILDIDKIGKKSYEKIFTYFYNLDSRRQYVQLSLFE